MKANFTKAMMVGVDEYTADVLSSCLAHMGIEIEWFGDGGEPFDVVFADFSFLKSEEPNVINIAALKKAKLIALIKEDQFDLVDDVRDIEVFDIVEKPVNQRELRFRVRRALIFIEKERSIEDLKHLLLTAQEEIENQQRSRAALAKRIDAAESALSILAEGLQKGREQVEMRIALKLKSMMLPALEKLRRARGIEPYTGQLDQIESYINDLASDFITDPKLTALLSTSELRVASLIRNGFSTEEIANHLSIAPGTVRSHRKRIRKKLGIDRVGYSLNNYLLSQRQSTKEDGNGS
ncbi:MAG: LuxR C-terminal-related transcriptional regulator [Desulfobacteraceae bacterium]|nr:LuxR C-terminal-related transcriptional regulator [Desulfobacteraceae bacterium]